MIGFYIAVKFLVLWLTTVQGEIQGQGFLYRLEVLSSLDSVFVSSEETRAEFSPAKISILFQCNWGLKNGEHCLSLRSLVSRFVARSLVARFVAWSPASRSSMGSTVSLSSRFGLRSLSSRLGLCPLASRLGLWPLASRLGLQALASRLGLRSLASWLGLRPLAFRLGLRPLDLRLGLWPLYLSNLIDMLDDGPRRILFFGTRA